MKKWFKFEMGKINSGIVINKKTLYELAISDSPKTQTKDKSSYYFNREVIRSLYKTLPANLHTIKLPISIYVSLSVRTSVYVPEKSSLFFLKHLGEVPEDAELIEGKYWMGKMIAKDIMKRYPTIIQFVRY